jgi:hypothetical protein
MNHFVANAIPDGYSWTLASRCGQILSDIEDKFGKRDKDFTLLGIEFSVDGPQIWYPNNCKNIIIQLGLECLTNNSQACYQLAHECVHLLSPNEMRKANFLEEGLATYYSKYYMKNFMFEDWTTNNEKYSKASSLVEKLLFAKPQIIKELREIECNISSINKELLMSKVSDILNEEEINILVTSFY